MDVALMRVLDTATQWLLVPVLVALCASLCSVLFASGVAIRTSLERRLRGKRWRDYVDALRRGQVPATTWQAYASIGLVRWVATRSGDSTHAKELRSRIAEAELVADRSLSRLQIFIRTGPMLGLVGTLLPLGPALQNLSLSRLDALGNSLNIAFTTTVFGIVVGSIAYGLHVVQRAWFDRDLCDLDCVLERIGLEGAEPNAKA